METVRQVLRKKILKRKIKSVNVYYEKMIESDINEFKKFFVGKCFDEIDRRGKWLLFEIGDYYLCSHLRMEGKYFIKPSTDEKEKHEHVIFTFEDGEDLRYHDTRKFGRMCLVKKDDIDNYEPVRKQGIEPIDPRLDKKYLFDKFHKSNLPIKSLLLDQTIIAGLGNIYANEVLFSARINPFKKGKELTLAECDRIVKSSKEIIEEAIKCGGTTIRSYTSSLGVTGRFQQNLYVHKRDGETCKICNKPIEKEFIGGRSTYYCPKCQK